MTEIVEAWVREEVVEVVVVDGSLEINKAWLTDEDRGGAGAMGKGGGALDIFPSLSALF